MASVSNISSTIGFTLTRHIANATEEFFVRRRPLYEVVGMMGFWGVIINGCQAAGLEHKDWLVMNWNGENSQFSFIWAFSECVLNPFPVGLLVAYTAGKYISVVSTSRF
jgi:solute carrier family 35, member F1/2